MTAALRFFVLIEVLGLAATPLAAVAFARLPGPRRRVRQAARAAARDLARVDGRLARGSCRRASATWIVAVVLLVAAGALVWWRWRPPLRERRRAAAAVVGGARAGRVRGDGAARRLLARRLADREADGHGVHQRRRQRATLPARGPVDGGGGPQLLLPRPPDGGGARAALGGRARRRLQPRGRRVLRALGGGGVRARATRSALALAAGLWGVALCVVAGTIGSGLELVERRRAAAHLRLVRGVARDRGHDQRVPRRSRSRSPTCTAT